jgi:beta-glucosidase
VRDSTGVSIFSRSSWLDDVGALLHTWYPGQEGGTAVAEILFGDVNPSGKLPVSFEKRWEDNATYNSYYDVDGDKKVAYKEGLFLGYRHFDSDNVEPLFPFGFGLSYTTFEYKNLSISPAAKGGGVPFTVTFDVTNTGRRAGAEAAQVYVHEVEPSVPRPVKTLKGFEKVWLQPGETKSVKVVLEKSAFSFYDVSKKSWVADPGKYEILVGSSSRDIRLRGELSLLK